MVFIKRAFFHLKTLNSDVQTIHMQTHSYKCVHIFAEYIFTQTSAKPALEY